MARNEDDDDSLPPLGEDTVKFLEDVKKGKPRFFLLVCKGPKVKYLKVKKKPIKNNEITEAKKLGYKGDSYIGVLNGKGMDLVFNLAVSDGYQAEPVKEKILKDFLEEHAELKCKPSFAIVATPPEIPFDEEDLDHPLIARFLGLSEKVSSVLDANPNAEAEIKQLTSEIRTLLQDGEFNTAEPKIGQFDARLEELLRGESSSSTPNVPPPPPPPQPSSNVPPPPPPPPPPPSGTPKPVDNDALKAKLQEALNKLVPRLKDLVTKFPERKVELLTPVAQIKNQLNEGDLQNARQGILDMGKLLNSITEQSANTGNESNNQSNDQSSSNDPLKQKYEEKLAAVKARFDEAISQMIGDSSKYRAAMAMATENGDAKVYEKAILILDRLAQAIERDFEAGGKETDVIRKGIVAEQTAKLEEYFRQRAGVAQNETAKEVAKIEQGLQEVPDEDPADLAKEILAYLNETYDRATEDLVALVRKGDKEAILEGVKTWRTNIEKEPMVLHLETCGSEVGVAAQVLGNFEALFNDVEAEVRKADVVTA